MARVGRRRAALLIVIVALLVASVVGCKNGRSVGVRSATATQPAIMVMHDYANRDWRAEKPAWGEVGSWMYWGWGQVYNGFDAIDRYLEQADEYGKSVAISVMLYEDIGRDSTPAEVYRALGRTAGWTLTASDGRTTTCPLYGDAGWEAAYARLVAQLGARYNGDPRVHSVWIATGIYGETVISKDGFTLPVYYFRRWVVRAMDIYREAFPNKPVFVMLSTTDRAYYVSEAAKRGIGVKMNTLLPDPPNAIMKDGNGQTQAAQTAMAAGLPVGYEHAMGAGQADVYWAMLYAATWGARVIDLPVDRLDSLAALRMPWGELMWDWVLRAMGDRDALFWVARQAMTPYREGMWEGGWPGPWERGVSLVGGEVALYAREAGGWLEAPIVLRGIYGAWGIGRWSGRLQFGMRDDWQAERVRIRAVVSGPAALTYGERVSYSAPGWDWRVLEVVDDFRGDRVFALECDDCWVHMVSVDAGSVEGPTATAEPTMTITPEPTLTPVPTATATPGWDEIGDILLEHYAALEEEVRALEARVSALEALIERMREVLR